ncbi:unnamed protein product [Cylicostephanus goldi]|uniref:Uncharacterized protein n=1 Tax=Cylicostephanus goldi TaxID=71465 RepID=A0A3P6RME4_CYLGO|nr:unnamed protein product [Cylicostephanus goldi]
MTRTMTMRTKRMSYQYPHIQSTMKLLRSTNKGVPDEMLINVKR